MAPNRNEETCVGTPDNDAQHEKPRKLSRVIGRVVKVVLIVLAVGAAVLVGGCVYMVAFVPQSPADVSISTSVRVSTG